MPLISRPSQQFSSNIYPYTSWLTGCPMCSKLKLTRPHRGKKIKCVNQFCDYVQIPQKETLDPAPIPEYLLNVLKEEEVLYNYLNE